MPKAYQISNDNLRKNLETHEKNTKYHLNEVKKGLWKQQIRDNAYGN